MFHESQFPRSCDRCHALKERCQWMAGGTKCRRCARLEQCCESKRPLKRPGRRPRPCSYAPVRSSITRSSSSSSNDSGVDLSDTTALVPLSSGLCGWGPVSHDALRCLERVITRDDFIEQFILGPSFFEIHREMLISQFLTAPTTVQDAYTACALLWGNDPSSPPNEVQIYDSYRRASSALETLRSLKVRDAQDISSCLVLGGAILTFALKLGASDALAICDQTLSLVKPIYDTDSAEKGDHFGGLAFLTCIVLTEIGECLLLTKVPTLRYRPPEDSCCVDRYVGLCATMLPYFYDLCELSCSMLQASKQDGGVTADLVEALDALELDIRKWRPVVPDGFTARYTPNEAAHMICQAQILPTTALLIIHRLRYPFGPRKAWHPRWPIASSHSSTQRSSSLEEPHDVWICQPSSHAWSYRTKMREHGGYGACRPWGNGRACTMSGLNASLMRCGRRADGSQVCTGITSEV